MVLAMLLIEQVSLQPGFGTNLLIVEAPGCRVQLTDWRFLPPRR